MKRSKINSDRNCNYCLYYRGVEKALDGSIICGKCLVHGKVDITIYHGTTCLDWTKDPKNPIPRMSLTDEEKQARKHLIKDRPTKRSISLSRDKDHYPKLNVKAPLIKSKKKQALFTAIIKDNTQVRELLDRLFKLPKRSSAEGKKIRRQLRKLGYYLSKKGGENDGKGNE